MMPKPPLMSKESQLAADIIETLLAGLKQWRPDLSYPESHSDMQGCVRALLTMYKVERRPLSEPLASPCPHCMGIGEICIEEHQYRTCVHCRHGKVYY